MSKTRVVLITGRAQSGKSTAAEFLIKKLSEQYGIYATQDNFYAESSIDGMKLTGFFIKDVVNVKQYSFADPLKEFCINVFGCTWSGVYGTDEQKNGPSPVKWWDLPFDPDHISNLMGDMGITDLHIGRYMTNRQLLQVFGTNICRQMYADCWALATKNTVLKEKPTYAFIPDARFPNELDIFESENPIVIRLTRNITNLNHASETALDEYNFKKFPNLIEIDNTNLSQSDKEAKLWNAFAKFA